MLIYDPTVIFWDDAPAEANLHTFDADGRGRWWKGEPAIDITAERWQPRRPGDDLGPSGFQLPIGEGNVFNWSGSLTRRISDSVTLGLLRRLNEENHALKAQLHTHSVLDFVAEYLHLACQSVVRYVLQESHELCKPGLSENTLELTQTQLVYLRSLQNCTYANLPEHIRQNYRHLIVEINERLFGG